MTIPLVNLAGQCNDVCAEVLAAIEDVVRKANFILGTEVGLFEEEFAEFCGAADCVSVANGCEALHLSLRALNIGPGDEVITAANTFVGTAFAIVAAGATPVFVDIDPQDFNLDANLLPDALSNRTKAIMPVHLYGQPANMSAIMAFAAEHGLKVIEDACQAHGATYHGKRVGTLGDAGCFSFYPGKNLGAFGDGGAVVTQDRELGERIRQLRNYGQKSKHEHVALGYNSRLDTMQAAVLLVKLPKLDAWNQRRRDIAQAYGELLAVSGLVLPVEKTGVEHVYHLYVVQHPQRDALMKHLAQQEIFAGIHYPAPVHTAAPFLGGRTVPHGVPVSSTLSERILSLPMCPELRDDQVVRVSTAVQEYQRSYANV